MSTQKGNNSRSRPQKYQNKKVFKNNLYDTSHKTKFINTIHVNDVCEHCKEIIEWKIKYKKYKPLTQPKRCVKCEQRTVRKAYHVICNDCGKKFDICTKCCQAKDIVPTIPDKHEEIKLDSELQTLLQSLPERKRRTFIRYMNKKNKNHADGVSKKNKDDLVKKLHDLHISDKCSEINFSDFDSEVDNDGDEFSE